MSVSEPSTRLTVSLPVSLVEELDRFLVAERSSRSAAVREALQRAVDEARRQEEIERFVRAYQEQPQTEEEFGWQTWAALEFFKENPE